MNKKFINKLYNNNPNFKIMMDYGRVGLNGPSGKEYFGIEDERPWFDNVLQPIFLYICLLFIIGLMISIVSCGKSPLPHKKFIKYEYKKECIAEGNSDLGVVYEVRYPNKEGENNHFMILDDNDDPVTCEVPLEERF